MVRLVLIVSRKSLANGVVIVGSSWVNTAIDIADDTVIYAPADEIAAIVHESSRWKQWWPDLELRVYDDRGISGLRWTVSGSMVGSSEIWIEPLLHGAIVHYYLRADPTIEGSSIQKKELSDSTRFRRNMEKIRRGRITRWKQIMWKIKDDFENPTKSIVG